jgi:hypothetical protein
MFLQTFRWYGIKKIYVIGRARASGRFGRNSRRIPSDFAEFRLTSSTSYMKAKMKSSDFIDPLLQITNNNCE